MPRMKFNLILTVMHFIDSVKRRAWARQDTTTSMVINIKIYFIIIKIFYHLFLDLFFNFKYLTHDFYR